jgi:hypothetical protein
LSPLSFQEVQLSVLTDESKRKGYPLSVAGVLAVLSFTLESKCFSEEFTRLFPSTRSTVTQNADWCQEEKEEKMKITETIFLVDASLGKTAWFLRATWLVGAQGPAPELLTTEGARPKYPVPARTSPERLPGSAQLAPEGRAKLP